MNRRRAIFLTTIASGGAVTYTISGTVYDSDGTTAVASATVALGALSAVSAANGTYTISNVPPGTSGSMTCTKAGYIFSAITVAAMSGNLTGQNYTNIWYLALGITTAQIYGAWQGKGVASQAASYSNLANPGTHDLTAPATPPTWNAGTGWIFNGTNQYLITGLTPDVAGFYPGFIALSGMTRNASLQMYFGYFYVGSRGYNIRNTNATTISYQYGNVMAYTSSATSGVFGLYQDDGYLNGSLVTTGTFGNDLLNTYPIYIGCAYDQGIAGPAYYYAGNVVACIIFVKNTSLTAPQITMLSTAMANL